MEAIRRAMPAEITAGTGRTLVGLIPYNSPARITERGRTFTEVVRRGAFASAIAAAADVISAFNHDVGRLLGRTSSGTLRLEDTPAGLRYSVDLPESAADVRELLARGDLRGSSFVAFPKPNGIIWRGDSAELVALELVEVGPVVSPWYTASGATLRAAEARPPAGASALAAALVGLMDRTR